MYFKDIVGQKESIVQLQQTYESGKIAHGQLFVGSPGFGVFPLALAYARLLLCENPKALEGCGTCTSCLQISELQHPDLHIVLPVVQSLGKITDEFLEPLRELVKNRPYFTLLNWINTIDSKERSPIIGTEESKEIVRKMHLKSFQGGYKIVLIFAAEEMNAVCSNKLLKILEEPPEKTVFLVLTSDVQRILPTIQSRLQRRVFNKLNNLEISSYLQRIHRLDARSADGLSAFADGDLCNALDLLNESDSTDLFKNLFISQMRVSYKKDVCAMMDWAEEASSLTKERQKLYIRYALHMLRQSLIRNYLGEEHTVLTPDEASFLQRFSLYINGINIREFMAEMDRAHYLIDRNANPKILFTKVCIQSMRYLHQA
ncbi:MAG: ATP-binding protein [Flavobacteriales bacterium]|jgi:DNA polymerase-3 subunit delta'